MGLMDKAIADTVKDKKGFNNINIEEDTRSTGLSNSLKINLDFGMTYSPNMNDSVEIVIE